MANLETVLQPGQTGDCGRKMIGRGNCLRWSMTWVIRPIPCFAQDSSTKYAKVALTSLLLYRGRINYTTLVSGFVAVPESTGDFLLLVLTFSSICQMRQIKLVGLVTNICLVVHCRVSTPYIIWSSYFISFSCDRLLSPHNFSQQHFPCVLWIN